MVSKWLGFSGVLFAGENSYYRVTAEAGKGGTPIFPSKNAVRKNQRKFLRRNGQRGSGGIPPEY
jgi:hypothetical protein